MENQEYNLIKDHLEKDEMRFVDVMNYETKQYIDKDLSQSIVEKEHGSLDAYLGQFISKGISHLQFYLRRKQGSGSRLSGPVLNIKIVPEVKETIPVKTIAQAMVPVQQQQAQVHYPTYQTPGLNAPINNPHTAVEVQLLRQQLDFLKDKHEEVDTERKKYKGKAEKFRNKCDELQSIVNLAEREKAMSLREAELSKKGFWDNELGQTLATEGLALAGQLVEAKSGASSPQFLAAPAENKTSYSDSKKALLMFVQQDGTTDAMCALAYYVLYGLTQNEEKFKTQLQELLNSFNYKSQ